MKKRLQKFVLMTITFVFVGQSLAFADPTYYPEGPQANVPVSAISDGGWTRCYVETMDVILSPLETLKSQCPGDFVLFAGGLVADSENYLLAAAGERRVVFNETSIDLAFTGVVELTSEQFSNGSYWYANDEYSVGFSPDSNVQLNKADVCPILEDVSICHSTDDGSLRLSLHASNAGEGFAGGYRIGNIKGLWFSTNHIKAIWVSTVSPFLRLTQISVPTIGATGNTLTCTAGRYGIADSEVAVDGLTYTLYINGVPASITPQISLNKASFDLGSAKNYSAYCQVQAQGYSSVITSRTETFIDQAKKAEIAAAAQVAEAATEAQRAAATAANFTAEARAMRKRIAARQP